MDQTNIRRERLRLLIKERSQPVIAKQTNRPSSQFTDMLAGRKSFGEKVARMLEQELSLPPKWFDQPLSNQVREPQAEYLASSSGVTTGPEVRGRVPLISWVQAGTMTEIENSLVPGDAVDWIDTTAPVRRHTYAVRVEGDSMEPEFPQGIILIVEPDMQAENGDFVIVRNGDDEATFKKLVKDGGDWYLKPINPRYPIKSLGDAKIVGVVREAVRKYR